MTRTTFSTMRWVLVIALVLLTSSCTNAQQERNFDGTLPVRYYRNGPDDVITLNIPKGYVDYVVHGGLPNEPIEADLYFVAEAATFNPRDSKNGASFEFPQDVLQQIRFNVRSRYQVAPTERRERMQLILKQPLDFLSRPCVRQSQPTERYGLQRYSIDPATCPKVGELNRDDILVERNEKGDIKTIMKCMPDDVPDTTEQIRTGREAGYRPHCTQSYELSELNAEVTISYAREFNKDWRSIQQRISSLLISFIQTK